MNRKREMKYWRIQSISDSCPSGVNAALNVNMNPYVNGKTYAIRRTKYAGIYFEYAELILSTISRGMHKINAVVRIARVSK